MLEKYTGVPANAQILMTSFGTQVKQDMIKDVVQATGKVITHTDVPCRAIYLNCNIDNFSIRRMNTFSSYMTVNTSMHLMKKY